MDKQGLYERDGKYFIPSITGAMVNPIDPGDGINIEDIAHSLSMLCRYGGHCPQFYSVAQHSVIVAQLLDSQGVGYMTTFAGLMHDASEAYLADLVKPLKVQLPKYSEIEEKVQVQIYAKFGIVHFDADAVKAADVTVLATEMRDFGYMAHKLHFTQKPIPRHIEPVEHKEAETMFMGMFKYWSSTISAIRQH